MFAVPALPPDTTPVLEPTVATARLLLVQVPPAVALESVDVKPVQTNKLPVVGVPRENTVTVIGMVSLGHPATVCDT